MAKKLNKNVQLKQLDLQHIWHPCTPMKEHECLPMIPITSGNGVWNALACSAALAYLELFEKNNVIENNQILTSKILNSVTELNDHPHVAEVRQTGMILAIEMIKDKPNREAYPWQQRRGLRVYQHTLQQGVLLRPPGNVIYFMPPYVINDDEINLMASTAIEDIHLATTDE